MKVFGLIVLLLAAGVLGHWVVETAEQQEVDVPWEKFVSPGPLTDAHAFLEDDCRSCHTALTGVSRESCVWCHANETTLLGRQPTAFHAEVSECTGCHIEHQGLQANINQMDHDYLAVTAIRDLQRGENWEFSPLAHQLQMTGDLSESELRHRDLNIETYALDCASCHAFEEPHFGYMGKDCVQCHGVERWTIDAFKHPSSSSTECIQCHQPPPSHMMEHFTMLSQPVARERHAPVEACFVCHQTTSWNDIKKIGFYKHH
jgi:hypothetical protein